MPGDVLAAAAVAAVLSGAPSTLDTLLRRGDLFASSRAAGAIVVGEGRSERVLLAAAVPVHLGLSLGWAAVLARVLPDRREPAWGAVAGLAIAALDLGLIGRRIAPVAALPQPAQWADHAAFGLAVGWVLRARRLRRVRAAG
jgi:hypothetical protein